jgi:hypothetical protein
MMLPRDLKSAVAAEIIPLLSPSRTGGTGLSRTWRMSSDRPLLNGLLLCVLSAALSFTCSAMGPAPVADSFSRAFCFPDDSFAFRNQLSDDYVLDPTGTYMREVPRADPPSYTLHCFVVARNARQFFQHARFEPNEPKATGACYRYLIRLVLDRSVRRWSAEANRIVIPGYANLYEFSRENEALLKAEGGAAWQSFLQRGNWRMVFPFSARHQQRTAAQLIQAIEANRPPLIHLVCFPETKRINHALLVFGWQTLGEQTEFLAYDPNQANRAVRLFYVPAERQFRFQVTPYFAGGPVKVYAIYQGFCY